MQIRTASLNDIPQVADLFDQYRVWYKKESDLAGAIKFLTTRLQKEESIIFVAENEDQGLTGFTQLYPVFSSTRMKRLWLLNDLFVHPDYRGQGISKQLIAAAQEHCRATNGCGVLLETGIDNDIGNQLYPRTGFILNTATNYYEWPCD